MPRILSQLYPFADPRAAMALASASTSTSGSAAGAPAPRARATPRRGAPARATRNFLRALAPRPPRRPRHRAAPVPALGWGGFGSGSGFGGDRGAAAAPPPPPPGPPPPRRAALLAFVDSLAMDADLSRFDVPAPVLAAVRQTVNNLIGTLPPQFFAVSIATRGESLSQLAFSVLMTGYMFANAWTRLELARALGPAEAAAPLLGLPAAGFRPAAGSFGAGEVEYDAGEVDGGGLAPGAQKLRVEGEVLRWDPAAGPCAVSALEYMESLEGEVVALRRELAAARAGAARGGGAAAAPLDGGGGLLAYLQSLSADRVAELTDCATPDVLAAMAALVERLMARGGGARGAWGGRSECTAAELAALLYWLMGAGHALRTLEVRLGLAAHLAGPRAAFGGADDGADGPAADLAPRLPPPR